MGNEAVATAARAAAEELAGRFGQPALVVDVEVALYATERSSDRHEVPERFVDPIATAGLIVALTQLAYQVYTDLRDSYGRKPSRVSVAREIRMRYKKSDETSADILDVVIREIIEAANDEEAD